MKDKNLSDDEILSAIENGTYKTSDLIDYCNFHEKMSSWDKTKNDAYYKAKRIIRGLK